MRVNLQTLLTGLLALTALHPMPAPADDKAVVVPDIKAVDTLGSKRFALIIGINDYRDDQIPDLSYAESDAREIHRVLTDPQIGGVDPANATLLLGKQADTRNILKALNALRAVPKDATVFIFFSGHGAKEAGEAFWVTQDAELGDLASTAVPDREITTRTNRIDSSRLIMFLDCCYAAATVKESKSIVDFSDIAARFTGKGRVVISASGSGEEAIEGKDLKYGVFTYYLLEALRGKADGVGGDVDGIITVPELATYIDKTVADAARQRRGIQKPAIEFKEVQEPGKFLLTIDPQRIAAIADAARRSTEEVRSRLAAVRQLFIDDKITDEQFRLGKRLFESAPSQLDQFDRQRLEIFLELISGSIPAHRLATLLNAIETPQQRAERLERERIDALVAATLARLDTAFTGKDTDASWAALDELKSLAPSHALIPSWEKKLEDLRPPWQAFFPMTESQAKAVQKAATTKLGQPESITLDLGGGVSMELVLIPAGSFMMGSPESEAERDSDEGPQHRVEISRPFYMGKFEVTQRQWQSVMGTNPSAFADCPDCPVEQVSWDDAQEYLKKMSSRTGKQVRLPTEAQWEYACRGGTTTAFHTGATISSSQADYDGNATYGHQATGAYREKTVHVGRFPPNAFGLYDMHGNVWEWCSDWYRGDYYRSSPAKDPTGPASGKGHVLRGGSWTDNPTYCRSAFRVRSSSDDRSGYYGFRVVASGTP